MWNYFIPLAKVVVEQPKYLDNEGDNKHRERCTWIRWEKCIIILVFLVLKASQFLKRALLKFWWTNTDVKWWILHLPKTWPAVVMGIWSEIHFVEELLRSTDHMNNCCLREFVFYVFKGTIRVQRWQSPIFKKNLRGHKWGKTSILDIFCPHLCIQSLKFSEISYTL